MLHSKTIYWWKNRKSFKLKEKKVLMSRGVSFSVVFVISFIYSFWLDYMLYFCLFSPKVKKINVTFSIYKIVFNYLKIHTNDIYYYFLFKPSCLFSIVFLNSVNKLLYPDQCLLEINVESQIWCHWVQAMWSLCVLGHTIHQTPQLFHDCLYQLLLVSIILPELSKYIILFASILHLLQKNKGCVWIHPQVLRSWLSIIG